LQGRLDELERLLREGAAEQAERSHVHADEQTALRGRLHELERLLQDGVAEQAAKSHALSDEQHVERGRREQQAATLMERVGRVEELSRSDHEAWGGRIAAAEAHLARGADSIRETMARSLQEQEASLQERIDLLEAAESARREQYLASMRELLTTDRMEFEAQLAGVRQELLAGEANARTDRQAGEASMQERFDYLFKVQSDSAEKLTLAQEALTRDLLRERQRHDQNEERLSKTEQEFVADLNAERARREADVAKLRELVERASEALEGHLDSVKDFLADEKRALGELERTLHLEVEREREAREADGRQLRMLASEKRALEQLEQALRLEIKREQDGREDDVNKLHESLREEQRAREEHATVVKELLGKEKQALEQLDEALHKDIKTERTAREADMEQCVGQLRELQAAREGQSITTSEHLAQQQQALDDLSQALHAEMKNERGLRVSEVNELLAKERLALEQLSETFSSEMKRERDERSADVSKLQVLMEGEQEQLDSAHSLLTKQRKALELDRGSVQEFLAKELQAREDHMREVTDSLASAKLAQNSQKEALEKRLVEHETSFEARISKAEEELGAQLAAHQKRLLGCREEVSTQKKEVQVQLLVHEEKLETHINESKKRFCSQDDLLGRFGAFEEQLLKREAAAEMRQKEAEHQAREQHQSAVAELLFRAGEERKRNEEALQSMAEKVDGLGGTAELLHAQEQAAREDAQGALHDLLKRERELREEELGDIRELLAAEKLAAEKAAHEEGHEARRQGWESAVEDRLESLERTAGIFDGLVRSERAERSQEYRRLWDAVDNHTHDGSTEASTGFRDATTPPPRPAAKLVTPGAPVSGDVADDGIGETSSETTGDAVGELRGPMAPRLVTPMPFSQAQPSPQAPQARPRLQSWPVQQSQPQPLQQQDPAATAMVAAVASIAAAPQGHQGQAMMHRTAHPAVSVVRTASVTALRSTSPGPPGAAQASLFDQIDRNHDGVITRSEFVQATRGILGAPGSALPPPSLAAPVALRRTPSRGYGGFGPGPGTLPPPERALSAPRARASSTP